MAAQARPKGVRVNAFNLADRYLRALGWPSTPTTRRVLAAWFMRESPRASKTDIYVIGNNPLNMTVRSGSYWMSGGGTYRIGIFPSEEAGINAFRVRIGSPNWGYPKIVSAFRNHPNTASAIILAINNSGWVNGSKKHAYVYKNKKTGKYTINGLLNTYNSLGGSDLDPNEVGPIAGGGSSTSKPDANSAVGIWGTKFLTLLKNLNISTDPNHIITHDEAIKIAANFGSVFGGGGHPSYTAFEGKSVAKSTSNVQSGGQAVADAPGNLVFGFFLGKTAAIAAMFVGVVLVGFGGWLVAKDVYNQSGSGMLDVTPIIVRE